MTLMNTSSTYSSFYIADLSVLPRLSDPLRLDRSAIIILIQTSETLDSRLY